MIIICRNCGRVGGGSTVTQLQAVILGSLAGLTIFLGLPVARLRLASLRYLSLLNAFAIGILLFLFIEVMEHAVAPVEEALEEGESGFLLLLFTVALGFGAGLLSLVYYGQRILRGGDSTRRLALLIAAGIGLHNFSEGLAIGSSGRAGELALALTLVIGFGLHNATEGFGIAAPLAREKDVSWGFLSLCGLIAGGPTFLGTVVGFSYTSELLSVLFLALAGGAIIYVINELFGAGRKLGAPAWAGWGITAGILLGFTTEFLLEALGG
jgi:ZIP family zinc transporter